MKSAQVQFSTIVATVGVALFLTPACKKLNQVDIPSTNPNPAVGTLPSPQPIGSVILGLPTPSPSATIPPSTTPSATPAPSNSPSQSTCSLASMPEGSPCRAEAPSFQTQVEAAQAEVRRTRPDLFEGDRVRSEDGYVQEVARVLRSRGLCAAQGGPKDEVAVKNNNDWNDQYDIVLGSGQTWTSYQVTCRPARF